MNNKTSFCYTAIMQDIFVILRRSWMCDLIQQNGFWAILGTIMGFLLYEVAGLVKKNDI